MMDKYSFIKLALLASAILSKLPQVYTTNAPIHLVDGDIQEIVDAHNLFRGMVDPPASNMKRLEWNSELAGVAQAYAETCVFRDNPNRAEQAPSFPTVGENLSASNTHTPNYTEFVERGWLLQRVNYNYSTNMCSSPGSCTDYVQLVWAETTLVGCGAARCPLIEGFGLPNSVILVCNYSPEERFSIGQRPYNITPTPSTTIGISDCLSEIIPTRTTRPSANGSKSIKTKLSHLFFTFIAVCVINVAHGISR